MTNREAINRIAEPRADLIHVALRMAIEALKQPKIIRCKDCKNYTAECGDERYALGYCPFLQSHLVMSEGFCAWAEKRGDSDAVD